MCRPLQTHGHEVNREGVSVHLHVHGFRPYFYAVKPSGEARESIIQSTPNCKCPLTARDNLVQLVQPNFLYQLGTCKSCIHGLVRSHTVSWFCATLLVSALCNRHVVQIGELQTLCGHVHCEWLVAPESPACSEKYCNACWWWSHAELNLQWWFLGHLWELAESTWLHDLKKSSREHRLVLMLACHAWIVLCAVMMEVLSPGKISSCCKKQSPDLEHWAKSGHNYFWDDLSYGSIHIINHIVFLLSNLLRHLQRDENLLIKFIEFAGCCRSSRGRLVSWLELIMDGGVFLLFSFFLVASFAGTTGGGRANAVHVLPAEFGEVLESCDAARKADSVDELERAQQWKKPRVKGFVSHGFQTGSYWGRVQLVQKVTSTSSKCSVHPSYSAIGCPLQAYHCGTWIIFQVNYIICFCRLPVPERVPRLLNGNAICIDLRTDWTQVQHKNGESCSQRVGEGRSSPRWHQVAVTGGSPFVGTQTGTWKKVDLCF